MPPALFRPGLALVALGITVAGPTAFAQSPPPTVPELFAGELDDVGPQYLLVAAPRPPAWDAWCDLEITATSNVTLIETTPASSTLTVAQAGLTHRSQPFARWGGQSHWQLGAHAQAYRYGYLTGVHEQINLVEISRNNFDLGGLHARLDWQRGPWIAAVTARASSLRSTATRRTFYQELASEWSLFWQKPLTPKRTLAVGLDGAMRFSATASFGLLPSAWNNRVEQSFVATLDQQLGGSWHVQPTVRYLVSHYVAANRNRTDQQVAARLTLTRAVGRHLEVRLSAGYELRESNDPVIPDFRKWDGGVAAGGRWRF